VHVVPVVDQPVQSSCWLQVVEFVIPLHGVIVPEQVKVEAFHVQPAVSWQ
jgi:hypothetical protein